MYERHRNGCPQSTEFEHRHPSINPVAEDDTKEATQIVPQNAGGMSLKLTTEPLVTDPAAIAESRNKTKNT